MNTSAISPSNCLVIAAVDEQRFALHLSSVERIVRAVEVTPLPKAPETVLGVISVQGEIIPVIDLRRRLGLPQREIELSDQFIIARTSRRPVALVVDAVSDVIEYSEQEISPAAKILPGLDYVEGVIKRADGLILIHNLDRLLSLEEEARLSDVMTNQEAFLTE